MRLIDADAMLARNAHSIYDTTDLEEIINNEPTAYDIKEVIRKIEARTFSAEVYNENLDGVQFCNLLCLGDIYETVKGG